MKLVPDARNWWTWASTWVFAVLAALMPAWQALPPEVQEMIPEAWRPFLVAVLAVTGIVLRVTKRGPV